VQLPGVRDVNSNAHASEGAQDEKHRRCAVEEVHQPAAATNHRAVGDQREAGGNDWSLAALLSYQAQPLELLLESARRLGRSPPRVPKADLDSLFPAAVRERYRAAPLDGDDVVVVDAVAIDPGLFVAPDKSPLSQGDVLVFQREHVVYLRLFTM
jgi:hypothetical protein